MSTDTLEKLRTVLSDRYRVERQLGAGGMATVYLAQDLKHDRPVAIKVLRPQLAASLGEGRFLREIQIAARLTHPHILTLHDSGEAGGLLYYVMPYVDGESLLDRVVREKQLPVDETLRLGREIAAALGYAHARGVVHRDIKPANILLQNGYALVADFGLARAITQAQNPASLSHAGLTVGTPAYMSPEQSIGEDEIDGRSDIYALGCVLYHLLTGNPPFVASNPAAILARHMSAPVPPIRDTRPTVPEPVERVVLKALQKVPADRYQSAEEFAAALAAPETVSRLARRRAAPRWVTYAALGVAALATAIAVALGTRNGGARGSASLDSTRYAVLPFEARQPEGRELAIEQLIHDALARWSGISIVDHFQIQDARDRLGSPAPLTSATALRLSRTVGAGRFIRGEVSGTGDSLRIHAGLWDAAAEQSPLREATVRLGADRSRVDSLIADLVERLLLPSLPNAARSAPAASRSVPARQAMVLGESRIQQWDLEAADSAFSTALRLDPEYAEAALWLAVVRAWSGQTPDQWRFVADRAAARKSRLAPRDRAMADAILAQSQGAYDTACPLWRRLGVEQPYDFAAWYGLATCLRSDAAVLRDSRSPSGWRFRASYQEVVRAYRRAFELLTSIHRAFRSGSYERVQDLLFTSSDRLRQGRALAPDTTVFAAHPSWESDSLVFVPHPIADVAAGRPGTIPSSRREALVRQRQLFREIATAWTTDFPQSAEAQEALAVALELLGDPSARDVLRQARQLIRTPDERVRVATAELWLRLKLATPDNLAELEGVHALGDSLLREGRTGIGETSQLAAVAALLGRVKLAAELSGQAGERGSPPVPRTLARAGQALVTYAAFGGPPDTLAALERAVESGIRASLTAAEGELARRAWLVRAAILAFPDSRLAALSSGDAPDDLLAAQRAAAASNWEAVRAFFADLRRQRTTLAPEEISVDALYSEARLLVLMGDDRAAAGWLDPTLGNLRHVAPQTLAWVSGAATLVRGMILRAELAARLGDDLSAARWARAVRTLWADADSFLQPVVQRMARLAG